MTRRRKATPKTINRTLMTDPRPWLSMMPGYIVYIEDKRWHIALKGSDMYLEILITFVGEQSSILEVV